MERPDLNYLLADSRRVRLPQVQPRGRYSDPAASQPRTDHIQLPVLTNALSHIRRLLGSWRLLSERRIKSMRWDDVHTHPLNAVADRHQNLQRRLQNFIQKTATRSVQPFLHGHCHILPICYIAPPHFPTKFFVHSRGPGTSSHLIHGSL